MQGKFSRNLSPAKIKVNKVVVNFIFTSDHLCMSACVITAGLNQPQRAHHGLQINFGKFPITLLALTLSLPNLARKKLFIVGLYKKLIHASCIQEGGGEGTRDFK